jgi:hypothetical protein
MNSIVPDSFSSGGIIGSWVGIIIVIIIVIGVMLGVWVQFIQPSVDTMPTPANMQRISTERGTAIELANNTLSIVKTPLRALDNSRNFLINHHVLATTGSGYIGPPVNGVYSEARAVQLALQAGVRCFVFDIEELKEKPRLITKKPNTVRVSLNNGYLNKALCSSNMTAFSSMVGTIQNTWENDPLIFYLRFKKAPSMACAQEVADALYRIRSFILRGNAKGEFNHRKAESQLFFLNNEDLAKKIIILSNIDTGPYNSPTAQGAKPNLDFYVHGRVYDRNSNQTDVNTRHAFEVSISYIMGLDDNAISDMVKKTRVAWHILVNDDINHRYTKEEIDKASACGIQAIAGYVFEDILLDAETVRENNKNSGQVVAKERSPVLQVFRQDNKHGAFVPKKTEHQYVRPGQVAVESAPREFNANGGMLTAPKL